MLHLVACGHQFVMLFMHSAHQLAPALLNTDSTRSLPHRYQPDGSNKRPLSINVIATGVGLRWSVPRNGSRSRSGRCLRIDREPAHLRDPFGEFVAAALRGDAVGNGLDG